MPGQIKIDDGAGNYTVLTNGGSLGSDKTITLPNTTGTVALTSDSFGKVLQVVSTTSSTEQSTTSTSYVDITNVTLNITPSSASSKILVIYNDNVRLDKPGSFAATGFAQWQVLRDSTAISVREFIQRDGSNLEHYNVFPMTIIHLDSPSSTSSVTYKAQMKNGDSTSCRSQFNNYTASIMALEIGS